MAQNDNVNLGDVGATAMFQYWNDLIATSTSLWQQQMTPWFGFMQRFMLGTGSSQDWTAGITEIWRQWANTAFTAAGFPWYWWARYTGDVPTMAFIVDSAAEALGPFSVLTPASVSGIQLRTTDLIPVGGGDLVERKHIVTELSRDGNRVQVSLVNLGELRSRAKLHPGFYVGLVYASEPPQNRPLVLLNVYIEPQPLNVPSTKTF